MTIIVPRCRFLFIHVPFCGGAFIKAALDSCLRVGDVSLGFTSFGEGLLSAYEQRYGLGPFATLKQLRRVMGTELDRFTTVALICDPELRVQQIYAAAQRDLQAYANRADLSIEDCKAELLQGRGPRALLNRTPIRALAGARDDDDFVARLLRFSAQADGISLLSYAHWLKGPNGEEVDRVFRMEQIDALRLHLESVLGTPLTLPIAHPPTTADPPAGLTVSPLSRQRLREALRFDYELFERGSIGAPQPAAVPSYRF